MSSYLLFLGMGDVERKTVMSGKTEIGIITRRGVVDQGDYALAEAKRLLTYYNDYFGQPYPLPKLDMIAGPGSSQFFGAMENWGAIFYFEPELLFDPEARDPERARAHLHRRRARDGASMVRRSRHHVLVGRSLAQRRLRLVDGEQDEPRPEPDLGCAGEPRSRSTAKPRSASTRLRRLIPSSAMSRRSIELGEAFDTITYQKGQAVIGMMESTLGGDVFRKGIRSYMAKYKYGNTVTDQLWTELGAAAGKPVVDIAHDFTLQGGVPLVKLTGATCSGGTTQAVDDSRAGSACDEASKKPQTWRVPLTLGPIGGPVTSTIVQGAAPTTVAVQGCGTLVLNRDKGSYVRVQYDDASHAAIVQDFSKMALTDQVGTLGDDYALALSGDQSLDRYLAVQGAVPVDASPLDWSVVAGNLGALTNLFQGTPLEAPLRARTIAVLSPVMKRVGFDAQEGESPLITNLRETLVGRLGYQRRSRCRGQGTALMSARWRRTPTPSRRRSAPRSSVSMRPTPPRPNGRRCSPSPSAEKNPVAKNTYVRLLGNARDDALAQRALGLLKTDDVHRAAKGRADPRGRDAASGNGVRLRRRQHGPGQRPAGDQHPRRLHRRPGDVVQRSGHAGQDHGLCREEPARGSARRRGQGAFRHCGAQAGCGSGARRCGEMGGRGELISGVRLNRGAIVSSCIEA